MTLAQVKRGKLQRQGGCAILSFEKMEITDLLDKAKLYLPEEKLGLVQEAYAFALKAHDGQRRDSGEPFMKHPLQIAITLAELQLDAPSLAAALLHDVPEDTGVPLEEVKARFGPEVSKLVDGVTKLGRITRQAAEGKERHPGHPRKGELQAESLRKMLVAMAEDLRVVFIKLADRLHNMQTLGALSPERRRSMAAETLEIFAPLAHRLGIWEIKWQLEDLAFRYLEPTKYHQIARRLASRRGEREDFILQATGALKQALDAARVKAEVYGRPKHIYSIHQKMLKYQAMGKEFNDIHDLLALRVICDSINDCYGILGVVHSLWRPLPEEFNDYVANPKDNGYQSLHTTVMYMGKFPLEVQIRTFEMQRVAEYGMAAHWGYKEGDKQGQHFEDKIAWLRQLIEWHKELSGSEEFLESVKTDIFIDQVFVYTPKGEIKELPKGATPLDFAYRIHTDLGHRCMGAKVNGRLVPLSYELHNGDTVEIVIAKGQRAPSRDWLNPALGLIKTSHAREKVRQWFKKQERGENVERGRQLLEKELKRLGLEVSNWEDIARQFKYDGQEELFASVGYGGISPYQVVARLAAQEEQPKVTTETVPLQRAPISGIRVMGVGNLLTRLGVCCNPLPGDEIIGYITRNRGITVHRKDCHNVRREDEKERIISVEWGHSQEFYTVKVQVEAWDRVGLLRDISTIVAEEKVNISAVTAGERSDHSTLITLTLETKSVAQLSRIFARVEGIEGVINASRQMDSGRKPVKTAPNLSIIAKKGEIFGNQIS